MEDIKDMLTFRKDISPVKKQDLEDLRKRRLSSETSILAPYKKLKLSTSVKGPKLTVSEVRMRILQGVLSKNAEVLNSILLDDKDFDDKFKMDVVKEIDTDK